MARIAHFTTLPRPESSELQWEDLSAAEQDALRKLGYVPEPEIKHPESTGPEFYEIGAKE
jgi:hypothetical protein